ncbi:hypothetical protein NDN01_24550 [Sphingomonas sp. QA11]|uniref:hypothetical protein n=1 Tax=Sphingomonas sp. QA11 TaxID=2950605 RepID=UPI00234BA877|nr:hypothetical protein [Sphingomonas sp. QA11]WCM27113.1 hypothetical protein NDN01_24550 [Sphingomonas sp. QA11]
MAISITVCNLALGELRAPPIVDIDEATTEAAECKRYYAHCLKLQLERFDWSFATRIASLAELSVNPRASEWAHAYALPADLATAQRLVPPASGWPSGTANRPVAPVLAQPFIIEDGTLFSQMRGAILEYTTRDVSESDMPGLFCDALAYALAARLAVPLRDSRETKGQLLQQAEVAAQRAIADDINRQPNRDARTPDEVAATRSAGAGCTSGAN